MINGKEVSAVIVARKGSVRIKSKSLLELNGETLIERKIKQLKATNLIDRVILGSDSDEMLECARISGAETIRRPAFYCDETQASANDMIKNMMELIQTDVVVWAHCTNPLISSVTYDNAILKFNDNLEQYDSLLSVVPLREHLWKTDKSQPLNFDPSSIRHIPAREIPPYYMQDGGIFIQPYAQMRKNTYFFGKKPYLFEIPEAEFLDINDYTDYLLAKIILEKNNVTA